MIFYLFYRTVCFMLIIKQKLGVHIICIEFASPPELKEKIINKITEFYI